MRREAFDATAAALHPLQAQPGGRLADEVYKAILDAVSEGRIRTGSRLVEQDLAEVFRVSRTPVREALRRLEADGMIESAPHRGFVVVDILDDAAVVYAMRQRLEGLAAALAAHRITVPQLRELERLQIRMASLLVDEDGPSTVRELARLNEIFHVTVNEASGSPRLVKLIHHLAPAYLSHQLIALYNDEQRRRSVEGHRAIFEALWNRDAEAADQLVQEHLEHGKRRVLGELAEDPSTLEGVYKGQAKGTTT